ncbi:response regulator transcription factor [Xanthomonas sp. 60]
MNEPDISALRIAVLEDDVLLRERILLPRLREHGFEVTGLATAAALRTLLATSVPDIVVLDVGLPDDDGFNVAQSLRHQHPALGVVMLTGRQDSRDRIRGLVDGADAYLVKPVEVGVLAATLHSLGRRLGTGAAARTSSDTAGTARWRLDAGGWRLLAPDGRAVALTKSERPVVHRLYGEAGEVVARDALIAALTADVYAFDTHRLDSLIHRLRRKVVEACGTPLPLAAVHGEGYVFTP